MPARTSDDTQAREAATPHLALLHTIMLLSGFGTVFLGPVLPALAASAHATDSGSGLFFTAQFLGAFCGGITTSHRLWFSLIRGSAAATAGFAALALAVHLHATSMWDIAALLPLGFGVGAMLTAGNLLAARRFAAARGAALARINFSWSLGAVCAPFLLGWALGKTPLAILLATATVLFAAATIAAIANARQPGGQQTTRSSQSVPSLTKTAFLYFAALLFLYGGVETSLSGWITTFGTRYGSSTLGLSTLAATAFWIGITAGRGLAPFALKRTAERTLLHIILFAATGLVAALSAAHGAAAIITLAFLLGLSMASWFPLILSAMLGEHASAKETGSIIAVSGLGAASLPFLVGAISRSTGSLRLALAVPLAGLLALLLLSFRHAPPPVNPQSSASV